MSKTITADQLRDILNGDNFFAMFSDNGDTYVECFYENDNLVWDRTSEEPVCGDGGDYQMSSLEDEDLEFTILEDGRIVIERHGEFVGDIVLTRKLNLYAQL